MAKRSNHSLFLMLIIGACWLASAEEKKADDEKGKEEEQIGTVIGIDLGTTYSCVAVFRNGRVEIIPNDQGNRITPSYVAFTPEGERLIGDAAKNQLTSNPENTIFDVKRFIGRSWEDPSVQRDRAYYPFKVVENNRKPYIEATTADGPKTFSPEEISAMVLGKMREIAESYLGKKIKNAVVTVPAYFNDAQRSATRDAGTIAGLNVMRIINEPTAAAIAYGIDKRGGKEKNILVFDLGGGTFDVSLLTIDNGIFEVIATNGNTHLGGEDFDQRTMEYFIKMYKKKTGKDIKKDNRAVQKLRREVEKAKRALSNAHQVRLEIEAFLDGEDFVEVLTRAKFEELNMDLFNSTQTPLQNVLSDARLSIRQVDEIVMVGGSTRIPKIRELVKEFFNGKEPTEGINPDEAVAYGAAVQGGVLSGDEDTGDVVLLDVIPLTLGLEIEGGRMTNLITRNTVIPTRKSQIFSTAADDQSFVQLKVFEGERPFVADNHLLGMFQLDGLLPAPRGIPQIEVTFDIDVNGILKVTAEDKGTGYKSHIVITNDQNRLSADDMKRMVRDAEKYSEEDKLVREAFELRGDLEKNVYKIKNELTNEKGLGGRLTEKEKEPVVAIVEDTIAWLDNNRDADGQALKARKLLFDDTLKPVLNILYAKNREDANKKATGEDDDEDDDDDEDERDEL